MANDPSIRIPKPRLPKAYTDSQLTFLKSHLPEFERRLQGSVRGDAKRFALERASEFIARFGLPNDFSGVEESESRFREQIYNWYKNTTGRNRRKLEGRPKSPKKSTDKAQSPDNVSWNPATSLGHYSQAESSNAPNSPEASVSPVTYATIQQPPAVSPQSMASVAGPARINMKITQANLRGAFLQGADASTLASMIQNFVLSEPASATPLTPVVDALFEAISSDSTSTRNPHAYLRRYLDASAYFPSSIVHASVVGPFAGPRALQMQIRKFSMWIPSPCIRQNSSALLPANQSPSTASITDEMQRIATDRQRRKDHIQWANIHAAALELGMLGLSHTAESNSGYAYAMGRAFSEMMARDAVWETDEVEWVAGICVLRAIIRTAMRGERRQRDEYDELLKTYEGRWKEIKDEARQALVAEVLLAAKDDLAQLDESLT